MLRNAVRNRKQSFKMLKKVKIQKYCLLNIPLFFAGHFQISINRRRFCAFLLASEENLSIFLVNLFRTEGENY